MHPAQGQFTWPEEVKSNKGSPKSADFWGKRRNGMAGYRIVRINDDIKRELSELIPTLKGPPGPGPDLHHPGGYHGGPAVLQGIRQLP